MPAPVIAASAYEIVLAVHVMAVVVAFGVTFAYPVMFAVGARHGARSLPLLHRIEYTIERYMINPGLLLVLLAGIFLASDGHHWSEFFVQWGLAAVIVIGGLVGGIMMPTAKRAEQIAERDIAASGEGELKLSEEYRAAVRRLSMVGSLLSGIVLLTILFMVVKP
jgi:Predicted integral membrane protein (DUF2269)